MAKSELERYSRDYALSLIASAVALAGLLWEARAAGLPATEFPTISPSQDSPPSPTFGTLPSPGTGRFGRQKPFRKLHLLNYTTRDNGSSPTHSNDNSPSTSRAATPQRFVSLQSSPNVSSVPQLSTLLC